MTAAKGFVVPAGGGKHHASPTPGRFFELKLFGRETGDSIMLFEETLPPGTRSLYHLHHESVCDSCRTCECCKQGLEQYCTGKRVLTYNSIGYDGELTYGGYSEKIVTDERYAIRIPKGIPLENAAPMFCAGVTVYSPLRHWKAGPGKRVAILGLGGLGHLGVQIASAMGAYVTVLDLSLAKQEDGFRLGADDHRCTTDPSVFKDLASSFDLILSTVPENVDLDTYIGLLALDGTFVNISSGQQKPLTCRRSTCSPTGARSPARAAAASPKPRR